jgi:predicted Zn-dependent peptidase
MARPLFHVEEARLQNGLSIRLIPDHSVPVVSLYTFFQVGSRNEGPGTTGISHLFEHMMFNGAKRYGPKEFDRVLEMHGGTSNAYTSNDFTVYYDDFAADALPKVLDLESDRMASLTLSDRSLSSEREVVKEERRTRVDNEVAGLMDEELVTLVYKAHPYRWPVLGWMADIDNIQRADCERFFRTFYAPNNAVLYLSGDFHPKEALRLIRRFYGHIPAGPPIPAIVDAEPEQRGERRSEIRHPAAAPALMLGWRGPRAKDPDALVLDVLQFALTVGEGSRLTKSLVYDKRLVVSVMMDWTWRLDPGMLVIHTELMPDSDTRKVEAALEAELGQVMEHGLTARELQKAKNNLKAHLWRELSTNNGRSHSLGTHELFLGSWRDAFRIAERYDAVTGAELRAAAVKYLSPHQRCVVTLVPELGRG